MIQCIDVVKRYGDKTVLNRISVSFEKGLIHGIVGRNGSGKTMLLKAICGFIPLSGGEIRVWGKAVKSGRTPEGVGLIIEAPGSFFVLRRRAFPRFYMNLRQRHCGGCGEFYAPLRASDRPAMAPLLLRAIINTRGGGKG